MVRTDELLELRDGAEVAVPSVKMLDTSLDVEFEYGTEELDDDGRVSEDPVL